MNSSDFRVSAAVSLKVAVRAAVRDGALQADDVYTLGGDFGVDYQGALEELQALSSVYEWGTYFPEAARIIRENLTRIQYLSQTVTDER